MYDKSGVLALDNEWVEWVGCKATWAEARSLVRGPRVPPLEAFHDIPQFCVFHDTCELFWQNARSSDWNVNTIFVFICHWRSQAVNRSRWCRAILNLVLIYIVRPGKEIACVGCRRSVQQQTCLVSAGLVLEKNMRPLARWKKDESLYEGHCRRWRSVLQLPAGLDGLIDENCSRLALDVWGVASHHSWVWIHSSSLSSEFRTWRM